VAATLHGRDESAGGVLDVAPDEAGADRHGDVVGIRLQVERGRVGGAHVDQPLQASLLHARPRLGGKRLTQLDAEDPAAEGLGQHDPRTGLAAAHVQHPAVGGQPQVLTQQPDLLGAGRILDHVIALHHLPGPLHAGTLDRPESSGRSEHPPIGVLGGRMRDLHWKSCWR
jgi:hypothetical protein